MKSLYYITHKDNLPSILKRGIFSYDRVEAEGLRPIPTYDGNGVEQRNYKTTDGKKTLVLCQLIFSTP